MKLTGQQITDSGIRYEERLELFEAHVFYDTNEALEFVKQKNIEGVYFVQVQITGINPWLVRLYKNKSGELVFPELALGGVA